jgi:hypothetical protein
MNTSVFKASDNLAIAESYYNAMLAKDFDKMAGYLHDNVHFVGPLAEMQGKEAVVSAAKNFGGILQDIQIRSRFAAGDQIMFAYDMIVPAPIGKFRAAVLMEFTDRLISKIELFYDDSPSLRKNNKLTNLLQFLWDLLS